MYIRFGHIPFDGKSKIWDGEECIGEEDGVSVYRAFVDGDSVYVCLPIPLNKDAADTFYSIAYYQNLPVFLVNGNPAGTGHDGEPLIKNVRIVKQLTHFNPDSL